MRKFAFNGYTLDDRVQSGVHRSTLETLKELDKIIEPDCVYLTVGQASDRLRFKNISIVEIPALKSQVGRLWWDLFGFLAFCRKNGFVSVDTLLMYPFPSCDIVMIYDCIREQFPSEARTKIGLIRRREYIARIKSNTAHCKLVLTDSEASRNDISSRYSIDKSKIATIYQGWQHFERVGIDEDVIDKLNLRDTPYCFSTGNNSFHKNFKWIVEAAKTNPGYKFVISGPGVSKSSFSSLYGNLSDNLIFAGYVKDEELKALMSHCSAYIQPSLSEGFCIPPLEAMSVGARCIVSNTSCLPEIYGDTVNYIDPLDYKHNDIDSILAQQVAPREDALQKYGWKAAAESLCQTLKQIE